MNDHRCNVRECVVSDVIKWIDKNIQENIKAEEVAKMSGYSSWHFQRIFRGFTGCTLSHYIRAMRLVKVTEELASSTYKITHIACDYGFPTQQILTRMFRKYFNCTPTQFRRTIKAYPELFETIKTRLMTGAQIDLSSKGWLSMLKENEVIH